MPLIKRASGILLPVSALPSAHGIGTFGKEAYRFLDFLKSAKQRYWQILPLGPTSFGDSPYQSFSAFALNPYFIDLDTLKAQKLLIPEDYEHLNFGSDPTRVDYGTLYPLRLTVLFQAFSRYRENPDQAEFLPIKQGLPAFEQANCSWLCDYALFMSLKSHFDGKDWSLWPFDIKSRQQPALHRYGLLLAEEICFWKFVQFLAYSQWMALKHHANENGISIIGDIPIYTAADSVDTWANIANGIFKYDENFVQTAFAGCPPDDFSKEGQFWGNPVYNWPENKNKGYGFWISRIKSALSLYDWVRLDHFRGLESYWEIPRGAENAALGSWQKGPGMDLLRAVKNALGEVKIIAEDLGLLTDEVHQLLGESGFPGMKVLSFAFDTDATNTYLPHNYTRHCVAYTGTHDNDTVQGWFSHATQAQKDFAIHYLALNEEEGYHFGEIRSVMSSVANLCIFQMQDALGLSSHSRINTPSTLGQGNWCWRLAASSLTEELAGKLAHLTCLYDRF